MQLFLDSNFCLALNRKSVYMRLAMCVRLRPWHMHWIFGRVTYGRIMYGTP